LLNSCSHRNKNRVYTSSELESIRQEFNLPKDKTFILSTSYLPYLFSLDSAKFGLEIKNHYQPIQAAYYDKTGRLVSFHINCYAFNENNDTTTLEWNKKNAFDKFIPITSAPLDTIISLKKHLEFLKTFQNHTVDTSVLAKYDYTVIVHFSNVFRPNDSKNLIELVKSNTRLAIGKSVNIFYVNVDNSW